MKIRKNLENKINIGDIVENKRCKNCGKKTSQKYEGFVLDEKDRKEMPKYRNLKLYTCLNCKSTRSYYEQP